jgi:hypothetical protein
MGEPISMSTENAIGTLSAFKKDGIIEFDNKNMTLPEYHRLVRISETG